MPHLTNRFSLRVSPSVLSASILKEMLRTRGSVSISESVRFFQSLSSRFQNQSATHRAANTRTLKGGAIRTKPACAGYSIKTIFHPRIWFQRAIARGCLTRTTGFVYLGLHLALFGGGIPGAEARPLLAQVDNSPVETSEPLTPQQLDLSPEIIEGSPVLQRWLEEVPNVLDEIRNDPSFRTRVRVGYAQVTSADDGSGVNVGVEDLFIGRTGLTVSGDYFAGSGGFSGGGAQLRYYVLPLGGYFNIAPVVGFRHIEGDSYSTSGVELGGRAMLVLSRTGGADLSVGYSVVGVGNDETVGLGSLMVGYAITPQFRLSTDIQRVDGDGDNDTRFGIAIEWMPRL